MRQPLMAVAERKQTQHQLSQKSGFEGKGRTVIVNPPAAAVPGMDMVLVPVALVDDISMTDCL